MSTELRPEVKTLYGRVYNFLQVLNEEQITKLRNLAIGVKDVSAFPDEEISELEMKYQQHAGSLSIR